jgi:hypothetical protein
MNGPVDLWTCERCGKPTVSREIVNSDQRATVHVDTGGIACEMGSQRGTPRS